MFSLNIWKTYLYGVHVDVFTDHKILWYVLTYKEFNIHKIWWLEFLKDYDINVLFHPCKANLVVDALRRLSMGSLEHVEKEKEKKSKEIHRLYLLGVWLMDMPDGSMIVQNIRIFTHRKGWGEIG